LGAGQQWKCCEQHGNCQYLCPAIKSRVFHRTFLSLGLGQQLK
jgi:hypothetical protein